MALPIDLCALQAMCKDKGLKAEGKREELLARLQEADKGAAADSKGEKKKQQKEERKKEEKTSHHAPSGLEKLSKRELQVRLCVDASTDVAWPAR